MAETEDSFRFLKLDYSSQLDLLLQRVRSRWSLLWNDFMANNFGRIITDLIAYSNSILAFTINRIAAEQTIPTMTLRESAVRLGALVGYSLRNPGSATVQCEARIAAPQALDITIPKGALVYSSGDSSQVFEVAEAAKIRAGFLTPERIIAQITNSFAGDLVIASQAIVTNGSTIIDLTDNTIDLLNSVSSGQFVRLLTGSPANQKQYLIQSVTRSDTSVSNSRLILQSAWTDASGVVSLEVVEGRVAISHGQTYVENFRTASSETPNQVYALSQSSIIDGSVSLTVDNLNWENGKLATASGVDRIYEVKTLANGVTAVYFGDGTFGALPGLNAAMTVQYRVGGGTAGNVPAGSIQTTIIGTDSNGSPVTVAVSNPTADGQGGTDQESLSEAKASIPRFVASNDRAVTPEDYEVLASRFSHPQYGAVKYARATPRAENSLLEGNLVIVYAWTTGVSGYLIPLSTSLKRALENYLRSKAVGTDLPVIADGTSKPMPLALRFKIFTGFTAASVKNEVLSRVNSTVKATRPGSPIVYSNMVQQLDSTPGVDSLELATPIADLEPDSIAQVITIPSETYSYTPNLTPLGGNVYQAQSPAWPLKPWAFRAFLGSSELTVLPDADPAYARLTGPGLARYSIGLGASRPTANSSNLGQFYYSTDSQVLARSDGNIWVPVTVGGSRIRLATGEIILSTTAPAPSFSIKLYNAQVYSAERTVTVYATYTGDNSANKRRDIRTALRAWVNGLSIGSSLFTQQIVDQAGVLLLDKSQANITDVILTVPGVSSVTRVALDSPGNSSLRLDAASLEVFRFGSIILNGSAD